MSYNLTKCALIWVTSVCNMLNIAGNYNTYNPERYNYGDRCAHNIMLTLLCANIYPAYKYYHHFALSHDQF